ncbi:uncharacterized protein LOC125378071 [Haliotis rufescens]|uniref:uncharacterized protein LOC125378071 n=1 Tax=Haliotis rufescens TaxID=6454 RepID=UPI00201E8A9F|nr:uncharacterized protein LOC125378071 [Haliotis rufescens]
MKQGTKGHVQARFDSSEPRISSAAVAGVSMGILLLICIIVGTIILQRCWDYKIWPSSQRSTETGAVSHRKECQTQYNVDVFVPGSDGECAVISLPPRSCSLGRIVEGKHRL